MKSNKTEDFANINYVEHAWISGVVKKYKRLGVDCLKIDQEMNADKMLKDDEVMDQI